MIADDALGEGGYEKLFWSDAPATNSGFRGALEGALAANPACTAWLSLTGNGIRIELAKNDFAVTWARMPALAALMEFLVSALGYGVVDEALRGGARRNATLADAANTLSRALYRWLADQLPGSQAQRRFRAVMAFVSGNGARTTMAEDIDDCAVLDFWLAASADPECRENFRSFKRVFRTMAAIRDALAAAREHEQMQRAQPLGPDRDRGEIDATEVEDAIDIVEEGRAALEILKSAPASNIKFLKKTEALLQRAGCGCDFG